MEGPQAQAAAAGGRGDADRSVSVVIPVKDGARYLRELLGAVLAQAGDAPGGLDVLVIDSGSRDDSVAIARAAGARGAGDRPGDVRPRPHAQPRRRAHERRRHRVPDAGRDARPRLAGRAAGAASTSPTTSAPSTARTARAPDTSPMIARELDAFFAGARRARRRARRCSASGDDAFLSNVNAAYRRDCWDGDPLPRRRRTPRTRASRRRCSPPAGPRPTSRARRSCTRTTTPGAVRPPVLRRVPRAAPDDRATSRASACGRRYRDVRALVAHDRAWMRERRLRRARACGGWTARSLVHHGSRKVFSALGSRAHRLPAAVQRAISLEGTAVDRAGRRRPRPPRRARSRGKPIPAGTGSSTTRSAATRRDGAGARCWTPLPGQDADRPLHIAVRDPAVLARLAAGTRRSSRSLSRLERMGHTRHLSGSTTPSG